MKKISVGGLRQARRPRAPELISVRLSEGALGGLALIAIILLIIPLQRQRSRKPEGAALSSTTNPQAAPRTTRHPGASRMWEG